MVFTSIRILELIIRTYIQNFIIDSLEVDKWIYLWRKNGKQRRRKWIEGRQRDLSIPSSLKVQSL